MAKGKAQMSSKSTKSSKSSKSTKPVETSVVETAPVETAPVENVKVEATSTPSVNDTFSELYSQLTSIRTQLSSLTTAFRQAQKQFERELRTAQKNGKKRNRTGGNRNPSGFVTPTKISDELAIFLGKARGSEMARTHVTKEINAYIRENKLQDTTNGRKINPDAKLRKLLKVGKSDELTYFNLQTYLSKHFAKKGEPAPVTTSA